MAKVDIDERLYRKIKEWLSKEEHQFEYQNMKQFITRAGYYLLKLERKKERMELQSKEK